MSTNRTIKKKILESFDSISLQGKLIFLQTEKKNVFTKTKNERRALI